MMPARVRSEGIALYSKGFLNDPIETDFKLTAEIDGEEVSYDLDGAQDSCTCSIFQQNHRYCKHIAAIEEYLKNQDKGSLETKDKETKGAERGLYNENIAFLDAVNGETQLNFSTDQYSIEVQIEDNSQLYDYFSMDYFLYFDLKLKSKNLGRSYVIKDIPYFLRALKNYSQYSLGSLHYIDLFFDNFDESSQEFLSFLLKIDGKSDEALTKSLYIKNGRYLNIPFLFLEEAMDLVSALEVYQLKIIGRTVNYFTFIPLDNDSEIFKFKVESQQDYIELSLFSEDYHNFYDYSLLYDNNVFYKLNQEQRRLLLVLDKQFAQKSKIKFSYSEKDKLAQALQQLSTLGKIEAPEHFVVKPFDAKFTFDLLDEKMLSLAMKFDYGTFSIDSFHDLETLEFSRDLRKEQKIFALMERLQFAKAFNSTLEITEHLSENFFLKILPSFQKLGQIELSPTLRNMRMDEVPEIHIDSQGGLLDISFDIPHVEDGEFANVIAKLQENAEF